MSKKTIADVSAELFKLLEPFSSEERIRMVRGTLTLLGESGLSENIGDEKEIKEKGGTGGKGAAKDAREFFDVKGPNTKMEELAAAARFRELSEKASAHRQEDFEKVITDARRNFDDHNFTRDLNNARNAGLFNKGGNAKNGYTLSYYGQNYIDALPDRSAVKTLRRPKKTGGRKGRKKKISAQ